MHCNVELLLDLQLSAMAKDEAYRTTMFKKILSLLSTINRHYWTHLKNVRENYILIAHMLHTLSYYYYSNLGQAVHWLIKLTPVMIHED